MHRVRERASGCALSDASPTFDLARDRLGLLCGSVPFTYWEISYHETTTIVDECRGCGDRSMVRQRNVPNDALHQRQPVVQQLGREPPDEPTLGLLLQEGCADLKVRGELHGRADEFCHAVDSLLWEPGSNDERQMWHSE